MSPKIVNFGRESNELFREMNIHAAAAYANHLLTARSTAGHGVHSPFMFRFITEVIGGRSDQAILKEVESLRREMLADRRVVSVSDLGAGSVVMRGGKAGRRQAASIAVEEVAGRGKIYNRQAGSSAGAEENRSKTYPVTEDMRSIRQIAAVAAVPKREAALLARIAGSLEPGPNNHGKQVSVAGSGCGDHPVIVELGTSLGISTLALALGAPGRRVISVEGSPELAAIARENLQRHGAPNAEVLCMGFGEALELLRNRGTKVALAFIDGNHRGAALAEYVNLIREMGEEIIIVADDIHMNRDMIQTWRVLTAGILAPASLETFRMGMLFCLRNLTPGRYRIR